MAEYFGVIGNRDFIKHQGERKPFWMFLDEQPAGWLCSLAYKRKDTPTERQMIWDCGAWSYKKEDIPKLGSKLVTAESIFALYQEYAHPMDFVIAPDHMLIPGMGDLNERRKFNRREAEQFLKITTDSCFVPMVTIHGETMEERLETARIYHDMGYSSFALGGLAGQASRRKLVIEVVETLRRAYPDVWLHVLGLSAPSFAQIWQHVGVNSFDGASHFKQAFTAGKFYLSEGMKLHSFQAARADEEIVAPMCDCRACFLLREDGIETRRYGSNETNMGRAAHNLNHLMRSLKCAQNTPILPPAQETLFSSPVQQEN